MKTITNQDDLKFSEGFVTLFFYAKWMPLLKKTIDMISKIEKAYPNMIFLSIDVDQLPVIKRFEITCVPSFLIYKDGKQIKKLEGQPLTKAFKNVFSDIYKKYEQKERAKTNNK